MKPTMIRTAAAAAAVGLLLSGCGSSDEAEAAADVTTAAAAKLDTGEFPTTPQPEFGKATPDTAVGIESQRMAEFIVFPWDVDPALVDLFRSSRPMKGPSDLRGPFGETAEDALKDSFVAGFATGAGTGEEDGRGLGIQVVRLDDAAAADAAIPVIHESWLATEYNPATPDSVDALPNSAVVSSEDEGEVNVRSVTAHDDYVIYVWASSPDGDRQWVDQSISNAVEQQEKLIDQFPATPVEEI
ncbi:MAG: hypothetical protein GX610_05345, partial [Rhodococcus sp.]|nr:hypothetical protein [Rhodococcus sp. (in: high G+C Gram-positive bacteria)]